MTLQSIILVGEGVDIVVEEEKGEGVVGEGEGL
jgi:hypothetical protein